MNDLIDWLQALPPEFLFLLVLPFAIGALGLAAHAQQRAERNERAPQRVANPDPLHAPH
jgi:hypothetical protein